MPAQSKSQRRLMGMAYAYKKGTLDSDNISQELFDKIKDIANNMSEKDLKDFAETKEDNLPDKKDENVSPGNVPGMGSVVLPENPGKIEDFSIQEPGSGDIPLPKRKRKRKKLKFIKNLTTFLETETNI